MNKNVASSSLPERQSLPHADCVLQYSRCCDEYVKSRQSIARRLDISASVLVLATPFLGDPASASSSIVIYGLLFIAAIIHISADSLRITVRILKRIAAYALAFERDVSKTDLAMIERSVSAQCRSFRHGTPATCVVQYHHTRSDYPARRLRDIYAESAFYSSHLLRAHSRRLFCLVGMAAIIAAIAVYLLARYPAFLAHRRALVLELINGFAFVIVVLKYGRIAWLAWSAQRSIANSLEALLEWKHSDDESSRISLEHTIAAYELQRCTSPVILTRLYMRRRAEIEGDWKMQYLRTISPE